MRRSAQQLQQPVDGVMDNSQARHTAVATGRVVSGTGCRCSAVSLARRSLCGAQGLLCSNSPRNARWPCGQSPPPARLRHGRSSSCCPAAQGHDVHTRAGPSGPAAPRCRDGSHAARGPAGAARSRVPAKLVRTVGAAPARPWCPPGQLRQALPCPLPLAPAGAAGPAVPFSSSSYTLTPCRQWFWGSRVVLDRTLVSPVTLSFSTVISTEYMAGTQRGQCALRQPRPSPAPAQQRRRAAVRQRGSGAVLSGGSDAGGGSEER